MTDKHRIQTENMPESLVVGKWLAGVQQRNATELLGLLEEGVTLSPPFESEVTHGGENILLTFKAFDQVVDNFSYHRTITGVGTAVLEFKGEVNGIPLQGVDVFSINQDQKIEAIEVMARPLEAVQALRESIVALR
jgi:hypothetical protein